jgi:predicted nucleic acid-binding Zn ribbon protein
MRVDNLPSPSRAERNQERKLAFIPMWPLVGALVVIVVFVVVLVR